MEHVSNEEKARTQMLLEYEKQQNAMMIAQNEFEKTRPYLNSEMGQYAFQLGFEEGVKFAKKQFVEKACEWIKENIKNYVWCRFDEICISENIEKDFKQAMKGE